MITNSKRRTLSRKILIASLPLLIVYLVLFSLSMDTALDRESYIFMMRYPFVGREEIGIDIYSYVVGLLISDPYIKLCLLQLVAFSLYVYTFSIAFEKDVAFKTFFGLAFTIVLRSNGLGVQLRIGFASLLFFFCVVKICADIYKKGYSKKLYLLLLPASFHYGTIPAVFCFLLFYAFRKKSKKFKTTLVIVFFVITQLVMTNLPQILSYMKNGAYYLAYIGSEDETTRFIPYSLVFYVLLLFLYLRFEADSRHFLPYFLVAGLALPLLRYTDDFVLGLKMLSGFEPILLWQFLDKINLKRYQAKYLTPLVYILCCASFFYFAKQTFLI